MQAGIRFRLTATDKIADSPVCGEYLERTRGRCYWVLLADSFFFLFFFLVCVCVCGGGRTSTGQSAGRREEPSRISSCAAGSKKLDPPDLEQPHPINTPRAG